MPSDSSKTQGPPTADIKLIRSFLILAEELHFGRAAARLQIVQPALTQHINRLEQGIGVELLDRSSRRVALTSAGSVFVVEARKALIQTELAAQSARDTAQGLAGTLTIGFVDNAIWSVLPNVIRRFRVQLPRVFISLRQMARAQLLDALTNATLDMAVLPGPVGRHDVVTQLLSRSFSDVALAKGHALCALDEIPIGKLEHEPFVSFPSFEHKGLLCDRLAALCAAAGFVPKLGLAVQQMHTALALVSTGAGIAVVPRWMRRAWVDNIEYRPLSPPQPYELVVASIRERERPVLARFRELAAESCISVDS